MSQESTRSAPASSEVGRNTVIRHWTGLGLGVLLAVVVYLILPDSLASEARGTAAVGVLMAVWWMTEAIPLSATALVPLVLFPALGVASIGNTDHTDEAGEETGGQILGAAAPYADKIIFLFMGGFMLALAMQKWGLHKRIALRTVQLVGKAGHDGRGFHDRHRVPEHVGQQHGHHGDDAAHRPFRAGTGEPAR